MITILTSFKEENVNFFILNYRPILHRRRTERFLCTNQLDTWESETVRACYFYCWLSLRDIFFISGGDLSVVPPTLFFFVILGTNCTQNMASTTCHFKLFYILYCISILLYIYICTCICICIFAIFYILMRHTKEYLYIKHKKRIWCLLFLG